MIRFSIRMLLGWALLFSFARFALGLATVNGFLKSPHLTDVLWMGFRFDLLVVGFILLTTVVFSLMNWVLFRWLVGGLYQTINGFYLKIVWFAAVYLSWKDGLFFFENSMRMRWVDQSASWIMPLVNWKAMGWFPWIWSALFLFVLSWGFARLHIQSEKAQNEPSALWRWAFALLIVISAARGTFRDHHLRGEDCQISSDSQINELCLSPLWTLDKSR